MLQPLLSSGVVEPEPKLIAEEPKLNGLLEPEPKLRIAAPAPAPAPAPFSIYHRLEDILLKKIMVAEEVFVNCYNFNPNNSQVKKSNFLGIL